MPWYTESETTTVGLVVVFVWGGSVGRSSDVPWDADIMIGLPSESQYSDVPCVVIGIHLVGPPPIGEIH